MELSEYETMFRVEDRHWWYVGMRRITTTLVARLLQDRTDVDILDAGCGTGAVIQYLSPFGTVTGCDLFADALDFCHQRGLQRLSQASVTRLPFATGSFDLVTSFDVLCHRSIGDYRDALAEFHRVLKPGGYVFLRLPAYDWLQSHHDQVVHTVHRFSAAELHQALVSTQFDVERLSYANMLLFPVALGKRLAERFFPVSGDASDIRPNSPWQDKLLVRFLYSEARWIKRHNLPFGLTVIAVGKKPCSR
jgi:SAM-dependent methyltransferase